MGNHSQCVMTTCAVSSRIRQAVLLNDLALVQRLLKSNLSHLHNPDFEDKSNSSLHLAAERGLYEVSELLIDLGHDNITDVGQQDVYRTSGVNSGTSVNSDGQTPLHLAAAHLQAPVVELLCQNFRDTINRPDKQGATPLLLAAKAHLKFLATTNVNVRPAARAVEDTSTVEVLLSYGADVSWQDNHGNTVLHNACAYGNLKALRVLLQAGADPLQANHAGWLPGIYSLTVQAQVYFKNLVTDFEMRKVETQRIIDGHQTKGKESVRLVAAEDDDKSDETDSVESEIYYET